MTIQSSGDIKLLTSWTNWSQRLVRMLINWPLFDYLAIFFQLGHYLTLFGMTLFSFFK